MHTVCGLEITVYSSKYGISENGDTYVCICRERDTPFLLVLFYVYSENCGCTQVELYSNVGLCMLSNLLLCYDETLVLKRNMYIKELYKTRVYLM